MKKSFFFVLLVLFIFILNSCVDPTIFNEDVVGASSSQFYKCESRDMVISCDAGITSSKISCRYFDDNGDTRLKRCSEGWIPYSQVSPDTNVPDCGDYYCYPDREYCRLKGLLTNPKVLKSEIC